MMSALLPNSCSVLTFGEATRRDSRAVRSLTARMSPPMRVDLVEWPGVVLRLSPEGTIRVSNGQIDRIAGFSVVGGRVQDLLEGRSIRADVSVLIRGALEGGPETVDLSVRNALGTVTELAFTLLPDRGSGGCWLIEQP